MSTDETMIYLIVYTKRVDGGNYTEIDYEMFYEENDLKEFISKNPGRQILAMCYGKKLDAKFNVELILAA